MGPCSRRKAAIHNGGSTSVPGLFGTIPAASNTQRIDTSRHNCMRVCRGQMYAGLHTFSEAEPHFLPQMIELIFDHHHMILWYIIIITSTVYLYHIKL